MTARRGGFLLGVLAASIAVLAGVIGLMGWTGPWALVAALSGAGALLGLVLNRADPAAESASEARWERPAAKKEPADADEILVLRGEIERHKALEQELLGAKQSAEAAMMAKGEFLATMSHEIRTPLNGIIPLLDILLSSPLGPDQRDYVQTAYGSARQLLRIVDDILDYSKLEASKLELETVGLNLREVLEGVERLMEKPAESKGLALTLHIDPAVRLAVRGDPVRLRQVLTNLVSNAIKFTERGTVTVSVTRRGETRTQHELRFEVRDTGVGISAESSAKLFQPFSQADASTTRTFGGTGLGLVICKRIVDLMNGQIGVESEVGKGSTFWFQIPLLKAIGDMGPSRSQGLHGSRIMVLTTDTTLQRKLAVSIPQWGATPVQVTSTQDALVKLRAAATRPESWNYHLLIVDLNSARTTALGLHRNLHREAGLDDLPLVYLQGDDPPPPEIVASSRVLLLPRSIAEGELRALLVRHMDPEKQAPTATRAPEIVVAEAEPAIKSEAEQQLKGHVLLVEDNPVNRQVASRLLTLSGLSLDAVENGEEAVNAHAQKRYAAILMDCQMPVMDGYTATREIRQAEAANPSLRTPIIAMTANAMVGDREKCLEAGMDDYLSKPLNRALLVQTIRRWIERPGHKGPTPGRTAASKTSQAADAAKSARAPIPAAPKPVLPASSAIQAPASRPTKPPVELPTSSISAPKPTAPPTARPSVASNRGPAISREIVDDLREIMGPEFESLVDVFLEDSPRAIQRLQAALEPLDLHGLITPAHSLKSTSANLGAMELSALAKQIEIGARQKTIKDPASLVLELGREFQRVQQALSEYRR
ncbi:hybrid sensor histidine kinase/response regulator [Pseudomarimonas arenosa]|uniref:histidine kinase n=1 Tax=Pseudomarimonas arenosa TaxID=2774145 RepID=A0AAW3ZFK9_9GAMM|nr:hybrid sensor histidine kinase/response regulator [Pseudomarimonas arenosa]MBD8524943.1 response regulator [Pseudomarimonas arenosa]